MGVKDSCNEAFPKSLHRNPALLERLSNLKLVCSSPLSNILNVFITF